MKTGRRADVVGLQAGKLVTLTFDGGEVEVGATLTLTLALTLTLTLILTSGGHLHL